MPQLVYRSALENPDLAWLEERWHTSVQRSFMIYNVPQDAVRGGHSHRHCQMALVCLVGSVDVYVQTPAQDFTYSLRSPEHFLLLEPQDWRLMYNFSPDAVLLVLADRSYHSTVYIDSAYRPVPIGQKREEHLSVLVS